MNYTHRLLFILTIVLLSSTIANATTPFNGALQGDFSVSSGGAATYTIPIEVPPGINGLQPNLALSYNSQAANGLLGVGWGLSGLSSITRCRKTLEQNGEIAGVKFDNTDRFCMNGQQLIAVSGVYGASGTEYRTEVESFTKVVSYGTSAAGGPNYFKVWDKSGQITEYGNPPVYIRNQQTSALYSYVWLVNKISDRFGNEMTFTYTKNVDEGYHHISRIDYAGGDTSVVFDYEGRSDALSQYSGGALVGTSNRLKGISTVLNGGSAITTYSMNYEYSVATQRSRLIDITECSAGGCKDPVVFSWQDNNDSFTHAAWGVDAKWGAANYTWSSDFNGDGKIDVASAQGGNIHMKLSTGDGFISETWAVEARWGEARYTWIGDFNGDGLSDIASANSGNVFMKLSTGSGFVSETWSVSSVWGVDGYYWTGDFNGDGLTDIAAARGGNIQLKLSTGSGFISQTWAVEARWGEGRYTWVGDFNGDGLSDLASAKSGNVYMKLSTGSSFVSETWSVSSVWGVDGYYRIGDFNGDGLTDIVAARGGNIQLKLSTGAGFASETWTVEARWGEGRYTWVGDFNGDGLSDLASAKSGNVFMKLSTGSSFVSETWSVSSVWGVDGYYWSGDFNGDGLTDIAAARNGNVNVKLRVSPYPDLLSEVEASTKTNIIYQPIADNLIHTKYNTSPDQYHPYPIRDYQGPMHVVSSYSTSNGIGGQNSYSYHYEGAKLNIHGRGFLGFAKVTMTDQQSNVQTHTYSHQQTNASDFWINGLQHKSESFVNGKLIGKMTNTWASRDSDKGRVFPYLSQSIALTYEPSNGAKITEQKVVNSTIDSYGNVGSVTTTTLDGSTSVQTNTYRPADTTNWLIDQVSRGHISATPSSLISGGLASSLYDTTEFTYYPVTGALWTKTSHVGTEVESTSTLAYNNYGNQISHKIEGKDGTHSGNIIARANLTSYSYSATELTVVETNPLLQSETQVFDRASGSLISQTGPNGLTTSWKYDDFGRKIREHRADGNYTLWAYLNCDVGQFCGAHDKFYVKRTSPGKPQSLTHYDALGRVTGTHTQGTGSGFIHKYKVYDNLGRVIKESRNEFDGPVTYWTQYIYDELSRRSKLLLPGNSNINNPDEVYSYHGYVPGSGIKMVTTQYRKGSHGTMSLGSAKYKSSSDLLLKTIDPDGHANLYYYDGFARMIETVDPQLNRVSYRYNARGDKIEVNAPDLGIWTYRYDALGLLREQRDAKGQLSTMSYDTLNRLKTRNDLTGGESVWDYDTAGISGKGKLHKLTRSSDGYQEIYSYDSYGRPSTMTTKIDGVNYVVTNQYDSYSRLAYVTYPASGSKGRFKAQNVFSASGYLMNVKDASNGYTFWSRISSNADGNVTWESLGNGLSTLRGFDSITRRLQSITTGASANIQNLSFEFDNLGNLESRTDHNQIWLGLTGVTERFTYDELNRLNDSTINGAIAKTYQYDAVGNIIHSSDLGTYTYGQGSAGPHAVTQVNGSSLNYDANGNMSSGRGRTVSYTSYNKPLLINKGASSTAFSYGPNRNLYKQVAITSGSATTSRYVGKLFEQVNQANGTVEYRNNVYAGGKLIALHTRKSNAATVQTFLHTDHLDSISAISKSNATIAERFSYDPFGKRRNAEWNDGFMAKMESSFTGLGFSKHKDLANVGFVHMGGRVYDPELARFISADPKVAYPGSTQGWNRYSYTDNNPLSRIDPTGYSWLSKKWKRLSDDVKTAVGVLVQSVAPFIGTAMMAQTKHGRNILAAQAGIGLCAVGYCAAGASVAYGMNKGNSAYSRGASSNDAFMIGLGKGLKAYSILAPIGSAYSNALTAYARDKSIGSIAHSLASSALDEYANRKFGEVMAREAERHGISALELNAGLLAISGLGNAVVGSRFDAKSIHMSGFCTRGGYCASLPFDIVDAALAYQGLPTASSLHYIFTSSGMPITGHSLGALDSSNLVASGYAPTATIHSLPFGGIAVSNVDVTLGGGDVVNGFGYGGILNPHATIVGGDTWKHVDATYPLY